MINELRLRGENEILVVHRELLAQIRDILKEVLEEHNYIRHRQELQQVLDELVVRL